MQAPAQAGIEPNKVKRSGVGLRGYDPDRAAPGYTLFAPLAAGKTVHLIDQQGEEAHTWPMPYPPGLYGYLTDRGTLLYGGKIPNDRASGDIEWKLGPPPLSGQHGPVSLPNGNVLLFDNGPYRVDQSTPVAPYSRVLEIDPATKEIVWKYQEPVRHFFFSALISNAQRLPNGNTFINEGQSGRFFEVTTDGDIAWEYVNPYFFGPLTAAARAQQNPVFRAYRYTQAEIGQARATAG